MKKKKGKYTSHDMQNELIRVMGLTVMRKVTSRLQATPFYTIMVDECTDVCNQEQVCNNNDSINYCIK